MDTLQKILAALEKCNFKVSTDTRKDLTGTIYFGIHGDNFDGNDFVSDALQKGAVGAVTDRTDIVGENIFHVADTLKIIQVIAHEYRKKFAIPLIVIGGSNGKTTSKELTRQVLQTTYKTHATEGSFNNHIGVPLSLLSMPRDTDIGIFEIGANHPQEHTDLIAILEPTHVVVTNNGMDHLEGFVSPEGVRKANKEIYDWVLAHSTKVFVNKNYADLMEDSQTTARELYPIEKFSIVTSSPLILSWKNKTYVTQLVGNYNLENIELACAVGKSFGVDTDTALTAICDFTPLSKRSQQLQKNGMTFIVDCYNANPSSMHLALESFVQSAKHPCGVVLGDMLELGTYAETEHEKIVRYVFAQNFDCIVFVGEMFKKALDTINSSIPHQWFPNSVEAKLWFDTQKFSGFTFLLKGSRGVKIEKILDM